jgi:hypothetical protein
MQQKFWEQKVKIANLKQTGKQHRFQFISPKTQIPLLTKGEKGLNYMVQWYDQQTT